MKCKKKLFDPPGYNFRQRMFQRTKKHKYTTDTQTYMFMSNIELQIAKPTTKLKRLAPSFTKKKKYIFSNIIKHLPHFVKWELNKLECLKIDFFF